MGNVIIYSVNLTPFNWLAGQFFLNRVLEKNGPHNWFSNDRSQMNLTLKNLFKPMCEKKGTDQPVHPTV